MVSSVGGVVNLEHHAFGNSYFETAACAGKEYPEVRHCWSAHCVGVASPPSDCFSGTPIAQHGKEEYEVDRMQACAASLTKGELWSERYWPFVVCTEAEYSAGVSAAEGCAKKAGLDYAALSSCFSGASGDAAVASEAKATVDHPGTPFITVNGEPVQTDSLLAAVCKAYTGPTPAGCTSLLSTAESPAVTSCPKGEPRCEYLPGKVECCTPGESCIPKVGCRC